MGPGYDAVYQDWPLTEADTAPKSLDSWCVAHRHIAARIARAVNGHDTIVVPEPQLLVKMDRRCAGVVGEKVKRISPDLDAPTRARVEAIATWFKRTRTLTAAEIADIETIERRVAAHL